MGPPNYWGRSCSSSLSLSTEGQGAVLLLAWLQLLHPIEGRILSVLWEGIGIEDRIFVATEVQYSGTSD